MVRSRPAEALLQLLVTAEGIARLEGDTVAILDLPYVDLGAMLSDQGSFAPAWRAKVRARRALADARIRLPVRPNSIWGTGLNYRSRARSAGRPLPEHPILYLRAASSVEGPGSVIRLPDRAPDQVDYEGEVAVVIGRHGADVSERDAWGLVAGITAANDLTARDVHARTGSPTLSKSFPTFCPIGASVIEPSDLEDRDDIAIRTEVNGDVCQDSRTSDLIFSVPELISIVSRYAALRPGDLILTGSPAGTGQERQVFLAPGDEITVQVEGVLPLTSNVVSSKAVRDPHMPKTPEQMSSSLPSGG